MDLFGLMGLSMGIIALGVANNVGQKSKKLDDKIKNLEKEIELLKENQNNKGDE